MKNNQSTSFFYKKLGKGSVLVFLHGFLESSSIWENIIQDLQNQYTIIIPDLLGHGKTPASANIHTMEEMAQGVAQILQLENITQCAVIGHSMGGYVALAFAEKYPQYLSGIMLMNSTATDDSPEKKANRERVIQAVEKNKNAFVRTAIPSLFSLKNQALYADRIGELIAQGITMSEQGITAAAQGMKIRPDRRSILQKLTVEKHYIIGKLDNLIPLDEATKQADDVGASYTIVDGGHMSYIESEQDTINCIQEFAHKITLQK